MENYMKEKTIEIERRKTSMRVGQSWKKWDYYKIMTDDEDGVNIPFPQFH